MKLRVVGYDNLGEYHVCFDEDDNKLRVDLLVDGYIPNDVNPMHLIGMEFDVEYTFPYISIAMGIK